jgi:NADH dehydrogenase [ubiquinone] 1 alpha subcomplex assembly factor 1
VTARWFIVSVVMCVVASSTSTAERSETVIIVDFAAGAESWPSIDDAVMGGVSSSEMVIEEGHASFRGVVSFDNNGGFASVRSLPEVRDLSAFDGLILRVRSDGKKYGFRIRTSASFDGVSYQAPLVVPPGEWTDVTMLFSDFVPVWRGRPVAGHPPLDSSLVTTLGLIVSRQEGPFRIDIASVRTFAAAASGGEGS